MVPGYGSLAAMFKGAFRMAGLDVSKSSRNPGHTLLGLRQMPIRTVVDVGANTGQFAAHIRRVFPQANLFCFEPLAEAFAELQRWSATQTGRVEAFNLALGDKEGEVSMFRHVEHSPSSSLLQTTEVCNQLYPQTQSQDSVTVKLSTLDAALGHEPLQSEILIKLDTQGYERQVIQGATNVLKKAKACIVEINLFQLYDQQPSFLELAELLNRQGYRYAGNLEQTYSSAGEVVYVDALFLK